VIHYEEALYQLYAPLPLPLPYVNDFQTLNNPGSWQPVVLPSIF